MNMRRAFRLLTPLLAAFVVACNLNESVHEDSSSQATQGKLVAFAPRLLAVGRLTRSDSVFLKLWTRPVATAPWDTLASFRKLWEDSSIHWDSLPVGRLWKLEIVGVTQKDTLWRGYDSGVVTAEPVRRNANDTTSGVKVRNLAAQPELPPLSDSLVRGTSLDLTGIAGKIVHSWGTSLPSCEGGDSAKSFAITQEVLNLRACGDDARWPSQVLTRRFRLLESRLLLKDTLLKVASSSAPSYAWDSALSLGSLSGTVVNWKLGFGADTLSDTGKIRLPKEWIAKLPGTGTSFPVSLLVTVKDAQGNVVETDSLRWIVTVPVTPTPVVKPSYNAKYDSLALEWSSADSTTLLLSKPKPELQPYAAGTSVFPLSVQRRDSVVGGVVAYSATTGRISDTGRLALQVPGLTLLAIPDTVAYDSTLTFAGPIGMNTAVAYVVGSQITAADSIVARSGGTNATELSVKTKALQILPKSAAFGKALAKVYLYAGTVVIDSQWLGWTVRLPVVERPKVRLDSALRTDTSLVFRWAARDSVRVTLRNGRTIISTATLGAKDSLLVTGLKPNQSRNLSVLQLDPLTGRESVPDTLAGITRNPPRTPSFSALNIDTRYGKVEVTLDTYDSALDRGTSWQVLVAGSVAGSYTSVPLDSMRTALIAFSTAGTYRLGMQATRDGIEVKTAFQDVPVQRTAGVAPQMPTPELRRGLDTLAWVWNRSLDRAYRAYWKKGATSLNDTTEADSAQDIDGDRFVARGLSQGQSVAVLLGAWSTGSDSTGGMGFQSVNGTTLRQPSAASTISSLEGKVSDSYVKWTWVSSLPTHCSGTEIPSSLIMFPNNSYEKAAPIVAGTYDYRVILQVVNEDNVYSADSVMRTFHLPAPRGDLDTSRQGLRSNLVDAQWLLVDSTDWSSKEPPVSLRAAILGGQSKVFSFAQARAGCVLPLLSGQLAQGLQLQWVWANGDTSRTVSMTRYMIYPALSGRPFVASGASSDTLYEANVSFSVSGDWTPAWSCHVKGGSWTGCGSTLKLGVSGGTGTIALSGKLVASGTDSIRLFLTSADGSSTSRTVLVNRTKDTTVTYRDGTKGTIRYARLKGRTWMAQNLNWDAGEAGYGLCLNGSTDADTCSRFGRFYTLSQAWQIKLLLLKGIKHSCDTTENAGSSTSGCVLEDKQGICPTGWHLPGPEEYDLLSSYGNSLLAEDDPNLVGYKPTNATGLSFRATDAAYRNTDGVWKFLRFDPKASTRTLLWSNQEYSGHTVIGGYFDPGNINWGMTKSLWAYIPSTSDGLTTGGKFRQPEAYPVRCVRD